MWGHVSPILVSIAAKNSVFVKAAFLNTESVKKNIQTKSFCFCNHCYGLDLKELKHVLNFLLRQVKVSKITEKVF